MTNATFSPLSFWPWYAAKASFWIGLGLLMAYCLVTQ